MALKVTKQEVWDRCVEAAVDDITGYSTARSIFSMFMMENDMSKTLDDYDDDDEFYTDWDRIIACDEVEDLYTAELGCHYIKDMGYEDDFGLYVLDRLSLFYPAKQTIDMGELIKEFTIEDTDDYIDWLWSYEDRKANEEKEKKNA